MAETMMMISKRPFEENERLEEVGNDKYINVK